MVRLLGASALLVSLSSFAATAFVPVPAETPGEAPNGLEAKIVGYNGSTNGRMTIDVRNPTAAPLEFAAAGLYFVPTGDPDSSPQRLGAVGPYQVGTKREERLKIPAGATVRAELDVYCIDSHRSSPSSSTPFHLSGDRVPRTITQNIDREAKAATQATGGMSAPASKSAVQSTVWKYRNEKWIKLSGEGAKELTK